MYSQLIYVSIRKPECTEEEIAKILASSERNNPPLDITGVLLYNQDRFIQFLEGQYDQIKKLYDTIKADERHKNVILVSLKKNVAEKRLFPSWAMGGKSLENENVTFNSQLTEEEENAFRSILNGASADHAVVVKTITKLFA